MAGRAMSLSSFCVVTNALRLNLFKVHSAAKDKKIRQRNDRQPEKNPPENSPVRKVLNIEGMMCGHCEATVRKALEAFEQVDEAVVSHENGTAVIVLNEPVDDSVLKKAIEDKGYDVVSISEHCES